MYLIKTYLDKSTINGVGVFAGEDIKKGTLIWELTDGIDQIFTQEHFEKLSDHAKTYVRKHAFWNKGKIYLCGDYGQFTNHSDNPNSINSSDNLSEIAARDIKKGEEITADYRSFDDISKEKLDF